MVANARRRAQKTGQCIACFDRTDTRAGMSRGATAIQLTRRNPRQPQPGTFTAPNGAISIPDMRRRTSKVLAAWNDRDVRRSQ